MKSIMRFNKGSKVEVVNKKEVPASWHTAEILSGNGHTYSVRYDYHSVLDSGSLMERVSRKLVRPCPPTVPSVETRQVGDAVEVFEDLSWKTATILKVFPGDYYMVRLVGCSTKSIAHKLNIRDNLLFLEDKWILKGKSSGTCGGEQVMPPSKFYQKKVSDANRQIQAQNYCPEFHKKTGFQSLKRMSPYWPSVIESHARKSKKSRAVEKDGRRENLVPPLEVEKVACQMSDSIRSDAESFSNDDEESSSLSPPEEEVAINIHAMELHAYRRTLESLHASGPLSWEQESMLTNLRTMLHVSNDEHLMEIRAN